jgi:predicted Fe-Mo cluster-binding NifX family protein
MRYAVATDKDYATVSGHAGQSRRWLVYDVEPGSGAAPREVQRVELEKLQVFHHFKDDGPHPLGDVQVVIAANSGEGFVRRMQKRGVDAVMTAERDPMKAVSDHAAAQLSPAKPRPIMGLVCKVRDLFSEH